MRIIYNKELNGWQIVYNERNCIARNLWNKPVNNKIYESWDDAQHDLDKWAE